MRFTKMQGLGNDYIYINCLEETVRDPSALARLMSDRHFGVGSDGIVLIGKEGPEDFVMRMFNADGSEAEMCGNAARCVGKYIHDRGLSDREEIRLMTGSGLKILRLNILNGRTESVRVDMGEPELEPSRISVNLDGSRAVRIPMTAEDFSGEMTCVSMGNPHAVFFIPDTESFDVDRIGPCLENHSIFPRKANIEFATVLNRKEIRMRVWERGSGETMACGTGACATLVAGVLNGLCEREANLRLNGGSLKVTWDPGDGHVYQEGPAEFVFDGEFTVQE